MSESQKKLLQIASQEKELIVHLNEDSLLQALICLYRKKKKSYRAISVKFGVTYKQARRKCQKCNNEKAR